ncbi:MAG: TIGR02221 family CRISPR-associated protein [Desulfobacteraceae bacterium]|nr:TIGR02221 family CRISPR-associated protein [Pseudomonadota bacterium]MCG2759131.1 TIGR02221 family CRISPR-associated protein [Desulfobacteraceae bacterium]
MAKVYLSFLGLGFFNHKTNQYEYDSTVYELDGKKSTKTEFVQVAEIDILGAKKFDRIIIIVTQKSYEAHFGNINHQLRELDANNIIPLIIKEDMSAKGQWEWFEQILEHIEYADKLTIDLTHGYRSIPIIFSTAINFLQKVKNITLSAVYYGAYEKNKELVPIIDMRDFYIINEWAEAVSRLVEDADARKLADVAQKTDTFQAGELNDEELINTFEGLTNTIRNVDVNNVAAKTNSAIDLIRQKEKNASLTGKILLKLVIDKFESIALKDPATGRYDKPYFHVQLGIISLLLDHKLFMQAYTVMREFIGSIGMIEIEKAKLNSADGRTLRRRFAEVFVRMLQKEEYGWIFEGQNKKDKEKLIPYYQKLKSLGIELILREFTKDLADYRNGFDHAWTSKNKAYSDIEEKGYQFFENLKKVVRLLEENSILV